MARQSVLGIAFAPQVLWPRIFDEMGALIPDVHELDQGFGEQARERAAEREQRLRQEHELALLRAELERLRDKP
jgi:hypothetical protein